MIIVHQGARRWHSDEVAQLGINVLADSIHEEVEVRLAQAGYRTTDAPVSVGPISQGGTLTLHVEPVELVRRFETGDPYMPLDCFDRPAGRGWYWTAEDAWQGPVESREEAEHYLATGAVPR